MNKNIQSMLGEITALTINTPDLALSLDFYKQLGFFELFRADWPFSWIQITDGALLIMLRKEEKPYLALSYYVKDINAVSQLLRTRGISFDYEPKKGDPIQRYLFTSPDGLKISLVNIVDGFGKPKGKGMMEMEQEDYFNPTKYTNKTIGMFGELAVPVADLNASIEFWKLLGFEIFSKMDFPYPWAIVSDGLAVVGLHQTEQFAQPSISYFAADMALKLENLKSLGVASITQQDANNGFVVTPEQQKIFLYQFGSVAEVKSAPNTKAAITLEPIGVVSNARREITDDFWGSVVSEIHLIESIPEEVFENIEQFSHLEIIFYFDQVKDADIILSGKPRGNDAYPNMGIFAQRKKDRPNKIGLCTVELIAHKGNTITVRGLDAVDGTPVLDIKPVFREFEPNQAIRQPEWVASLMKEYWL
jgi:tRNA (adenine37-N6)-methyltransferase